MTQRICQKLDGVSRIYGGLDEFNEMESYTKKHRRIFEAQSLEELQKLTDEIVFLDEKDILKICIFFPWRGQRRLSRSMP